MKTNPRYINVFQILHRVAWVFESNTHLCGDQIRWYRNLDHVLPKQNLCSSCVFGTVSQEGKSVKLKHRFCPHHLNKILPQHNLFNFLKKENELKGKINSISLSPGAQARAIGCPPVPRTCTTMV